VHEGLLLPTPCFCCSRCPWPCCNCKNHNFKSANLQLKVQL
jgi:hypothetical protein